MTSEEHFDRILREYGPALRRLASSYERNAAAREDLLQEILLAVWRALPRFRGECSEKTFVFRIAHNRAITHCFRGGCQTTDIESAAEVSDPRPTPEYEASMSQRREHLLAALHSLPVATRQILGLALEGLSRAELAEVLGITENAATVRLSRARAALKRQLDMREGAIR
jgi:RNA polymerase sigma factor (sigma-70 family)